MQACREFTEQLNGLELAILAHLAALDAAFEESFEGLHVTSRELTGVGCFTNFQSEAECMTWDRHVDIDALIRIPGVPNGLGAVLFCRGSEPLSLETYTFGESWDGTFDGFEIEPC